MDHDRTVQGGWAVALACAILLGSLAPGCNKADPQPATPVPRIALIRRGAGDEFWRALRAGAARAAREGGRVELVCRNAQDATSGDSQAELVRQLLADHVSAIVLAPSPGAALPGAIREAQAAGVPVVLIDDFPDPARGLPEAPRVSSNNRHAGEAAADFIIRTLVGAKRVLIVGDGRGSEGADEREAAFRERISRQSGMSTFDASPAVGAARRQAHLAVEYALDEHPDVDVIFCPDEPTTVGALLALRDRTMVGRVPVVGVDTNASLVEAMASGEVEALVLQDPDEIGYRAVRTALAASKGQKVEDRSLVPVLLIPRTAMHERANLDRLLPNLSGTDD